MVFKVKAMRLRKPHLGESMDVDLRFLNVIHFSAPSWSEEEKSDGHFKLDAVARRSDCHYISLACGRLVSRQSKPKTHQGSKKGFHHDGMFARAARTLQERRSRSRGKARLAPTT